MSYNVSEYNYISSYHEGKKGYINKFEKSLKLPFMNVLQNHIPINKNIRPDDSEYIDSELSVSDNVELSSAITRVSEVTDSSSANTV